MSRGVGRLVCTPVGSNEEDEDMVRGRGEGETPMNVLIVTHYPGLYGANRSLLDLLDGAGDRISPVVVVPREGPLLEELRTRGVECRVIRFRPWYYELHPYPLFDLSRKWRGLFAHHLVNGLMERLDSRSLGRFDLVYTNSGMTDFGHRLACRL